MNAKTEGEKILNTGFESGLLRGYLAGEVKYNENGEIWEFRIYEVSIHTKHEKRKKQSKRDDR
jgi:hypothetical protein